MKETIVEWVRRALGNPQDKPKYRVEFEELEVATGESSAELKSFVADRQHAPHSWCQHRPTCRTAAEHERKS